jgi:carboxypeptidase D
MVFFDALFANATEKNVQIIFYSGNDDFILAHRGTEVVIQVGLYFRFLKTA